MKKIVSILVFTAMICMTGSLAICSYAGTETLAENEGMQIVVTIFPEYDWVMNVLGDNPANAEVTLILDNGVDLHSYQPTVDDILTISTCDCFIYVGGESDAWVKDTLQNSMNPDRMDINLLDALGDAVKAEEIVPGMQEAEHDHDHEEEAGEEGQNHEEDVSEEEGHDHEEDVAEEEHSEEAGEEGQNHSEETGEEEHKHNEEEGTDHDHEEEADEHVWLSLRNAAVLVNTISETLQSLDPAYAQTYESNAAAYIEKLNALDAEYTAAVESAPFDTLLFGDRFPFRYLTDDYGLTYYAAFAGCSAESEASFETVIFLSQTMDELGLHAVMTIDGSDCSIAETIVQSTKAKDQQILTLNSMQSITADDMAAGTTYLSIMEENLAVLKEALK